MIASGGTAIASTTCEKRSARYADPGGSLRVEGRALEAARDLVGHVERQEQRRGGEGGQHGAAVGVDAAPPHERPPAQQQHGGQRVEQGVQGREQRDVHVRLTAPRSGARPAPDPATAVRAPAPPPRPAGLRPTRTGRRAGGRRASPRRSAPAREPARRWPGTSPSRSRAGSAGAASDTMLISAGWSTARPTAQSASGTSSSATEPAWESARKPAASSRLPAIASERSLQRAASLFMPPAWIAPISTAIAISSTRDVARVVAEAIPHEEGEDRLELRDRQREDEVREAEPPDQRRAQSAGRAGRLRGGGRAPPARAARAPRGRGSRRPDRRPRTSEPRIRRARAAPRSPAPARSRRRSRRPASPSSGCAPARRSRR